MQRYNHQSIPSLSSSISSNDTNIATPRTSSSSCRPYLNKRNSEPPMKRWDDSQLEIELAEDDLIEEKKIRRNSLRFKLQQSESFLIDKFRQRNKESKQKRLSNSIKRLCKWLF
ncbi:hypothetical protein BDB01DRAFT_803586 [Pilobolus umbonatus]|nr:hypothetical protein BDB01DRAFT_803586 [Pilobolus umbonatus]